MRTAGGTVKQHGRPRRRNRYQKPSKQQPVSAVADTQAKARHQGAVNVSGIKWACSGTHCSASAMPSAVAAPVAVCQGLARKVGVIRSFKVADRPLNGNELQQCNSVVPAVTAAKSGMKTPQEAGRAPTAQAPGVALPPAKQPSGAKGTTPAPRVIRADTLRYAGSTRGPVVINASPLRYVGRGPVVIQADTLRYAGRGPVVINAATLSYRGPNNAPIVINAEPLRYAGSTRGPVVINAGPLRYVGGGAVVINASPLRYAGRGPVVINANTLKYSGNTR